MAAEPEGVPISQSKRPKAQRSRALLVLSAPLWLPFAAVYGLMRICGDGLHFVLEGSGRSLSLRNPAQRLIFYLVALPVFPLVITFDTALSFLRQLGTAPARLMGRQAPRTPLALALGLLLLTLSPLWFPLFSTLWLALVLVPGLGGATLDQMGRSIGALRSPDDFRVRGHFETFVALRYMRAQRSGDGIGVVTALTILGVTLGVWTLVVVLSVMAGFEADLQDKILGANAHIVVLSYNDQIPDWQQNVERIRDVQGVAGATPFVYSEFMLRSRDSRIGAIFKGIDSTTVGTASDLLRNIKLGRGGRVTSLEEAQAIVDGLDVPAGAEQESRTGDSSPSIESQKPRLPGILIGQEMQSALRVTVGDTIQAVSPLSTPGPMGSMNARIIEFEVHGVFHSGMYEYDTKFTYAGLGTAQDFMKLGESVTGIEVTLDDIYEAPSVADAIQDRLGYPFWTRDWQKMNEPLFAALKLEKLVMGLILTFIIAVASMNIISTLTMLVVEKRREIAIMKAMGAGRFDLMKLFMIDGLLVGFIGTVLGLSAGLATCMALARWKFIELQSDVYYVDTLPVHISPGLITLVGLLAVLISFAATVLPAWQGSSLDPVEGLRDA